jgi:squalene-hopene/tetraprenyl-beta-curcumene cyclase
MMAAEAGRPDARAGDTRQRPGLNAALAGRMLKAMRRLAGWPFIVLISLTCASRAAPPSAGQVSAEPGDSRGAITPDEPIATQFSTERAARYLDSAAINWHKTHRCTACHTMLPYMMARPYLNEIAPPSAEIRQFFEEIAAGKRDAMPDYECKDIDGAVAIGVGVSLALNDRWSRGQLHPLTRQALDRMWTLQRADGGWEWPFRDTPPLKVGEHYGVTLAAIGTGMAPGRYADTPAAKTGIEGIRRFLKERSACTLHEKAMLLWASMYIDELLSDEAKAEILLDLVLAQRSDGGWSMASLVDNTGDPALDPDRVIEARSKPGYGASVLAYVGRDKTFTSSLASDGYATGFVIFVARQAQMPASDVRLQRGIAWLKTHQRESGRWFTPSQSWHTRHLIANAGTAYAVMAIFACDER